MAASFQKSTRDWPLSVSHTFTVWSEEPLTYLFTVSVYRALDTPQRRGERQGDGGVAQDLILCYGARSPRPAFFSSS